MPPSRAVMILRPYGYAIWENIQRIMDGDVQEDRPCQRGHARADPREPAAEGEASMVEGFAPEVRLGHHGRQREAGGASVPSAPPPRPCSATIGTTCMHSWRELPMLYNQWCSVHPLGKDHPPLPAPPGVPGGRRATPSTPRRRRPSPRPSSMLNMLRRLLPRTCWPCRWSRAARPTRRSSPAPRRPTPSSA